MRRAEANQEARRPRRAKAAAAALALIAGCATIACGKYGPPRRVPPDAASAATPDAADSGRAWARAVGRSENTR